MRPPAIQNAIKLIAKIFYIYIYFDYFFFNPKVYSRKTSPAKYTNLTEKKLIIRSEKNAMKFLSTITVIFKYKKKTRIVFFLSAKSFLVVTNQKVEAACVYFIKPWRINHFFMSNQKHLIILFMTYVSDKNIHVTPKLSHIIALNKVIFS